MDLDAMTKAFHELILAVNKAHYLANKGNMAGAAHTLFGVVGMTQNMLRAIRKEDLAAAASMGTEETS